MYHQYLKTYCDSLLFYNDSIIRIDKGKEIIAYKEKFNNESFCQGNSMKTTDIFALSLKLYIFVISA